ncbi:MAG: hypothetical protein O7D86_06390 [Proteobacteria bacterium]|nr:hypothetical protein [Pseudomonadota bacterium]
MSNLHANDPKVLANWIDIQLKHPVTKTNFVRQLIAAARMTHEQSAPNCDGLLLLSQQDRMVHPDCTKDQSSVNRAYCTKNIRKSPG